MDRGDRYSALELVQADAWSDAMTRDLASIPGDPAGPEYYRMLFEASDLGAYEVKIAGAMVGTVLYRIEETEFGREFVIVAAAGAAEGYNLTLELFKILELEAERLGARCVRLHTNRRGLIRKAGAEGYSVTEIVLRKALTVASREVH